MPLIVNTNLDSINAQRNLSMVNFELSKTFMRLSSGKRINTAGDDAAGLALVNQFETDIRGMRQAVNNAQDASALLNIADGSAQSIVKNLQRIRELATQAANDTYGSTERSQIRTEIVQLFDEITRIANAANFNGIKLLNNSTPAAMNIQVGSGNDTSATTTDVLDIVSALGDLTATNGLSLGTAAVTNNVQANYLKSRIDTALNTVNSQLAVLGAFQNRLAGIVENLQISIQNTSAAQSRIQDADIAAETSKLTKLQITQQATLSVLSQANISPQGALRLLS
ncbi:MAG: flagellin FliC [Cyanobacteria bacterium HKST-UBA06]|nr:flagellin FliC [Cyanobacteria bacterium HKST-UBA06]